METVVAYRCWHVDDLVEGVEFFLEETKRDIKMSDEDKSKGEDTLKAISYQEFGSNSQTASFLIVLRGPILNQSTSKSASEVC